MKRAVALIATLALLVAAITLGRGGSSRRHTAASPGDCLAKMFNAAEKGDVPAYLDCFTGPRRGRLERELAAQGAAEFAAALRDAVRSLKGRAVSGLGGAEPNATIATLSVDRVYAQHTERQSYHFVRQTDGWRIDSVGAVENHQPPVAYGTPVFELAPGEK